MKYSYLATRSCCVNMSFIIIKKLSRHKNTLAYYVAPCGSTESKFNEIDTWSPLLENRKADVSTFGRKLDVSEFCRKLKLFSLTGPGCRDEAPKWDRDRDEEDESIGSLPIYIFKIFRCVCSNVYDECLTIVKVNTHSDRTNCSL